MKKISTLALTLGLTILGGISFGQTIHADEETSTQAQVTVSAGDLTISRLQNMDFGAHSITGGEIIVTENTADVGIEDLRGSSNQGWTLTAKLKSGDFDGLGLKFSPEITENNAVAVASNTQFLNTGAQTVASVPDEAIIDSAFDTSLVLNSELTIPAHTKANTYLTTIVWNLASTPESR